MVYVRGHDDRDKVKDARDKARRIVADRKEIVRIRSFASRNLGNPFPPFQTPSQLGYGKQDGVLYAKRQRQAQIANTDFMKSAFPVDSNNYINNYSSFVVPGRQIINDTIGTGLIGNIYRGL